MMASFCEMNSSYLQSISGVDTDTNHIKLAPETVRERSISLNFLCANKSHSHRIRLYAHRFSTVPHPFIHPYRSLRRPRASLHPNAPLTENGPVTPSAGSDTGLVLHNLNRLEAGLRGQHIEADLDVDGQDMLQKDVPMVNGIDHHPNGTNTDLANGDVEEDESGWQSIGEFEREQEEVEGDLGERGDDVLDRDVEGGEIQVRTIVRGDLDKEARKKAKKERHKALRRELEDQRRKESSP